jgi:hypothetical protein
MKMGNPVKLTKAIVLPLVLTSGAAIMSEARAQNTRSTAGQDDRSNDHDYGWLGLLAFLV